MAGKFLDKALGIAVRNLGINFELSADVLVPRQVGKDQFRLRLSRPANFEEIDGARAAGEVGGWN